MEIIKRPLTLDKERYATFQALDVSSRVKLLAAHDYTVILTEMFVSKDVFYSLSFPQIRVIFEDCIVDHDVVEKIFYNFWNVADWQFYHCAMGKEVKCTLSDNQYTLLTGFSDEKHQEGILVFGFGWDYVDTFRGHHALWVFVPESKEILDDILVEWITDELKTDDMELIRETYKKEYGKELPDNWGEKQIYIGNSIYPDDADNILLKNDNIVDVINPIIPKNDNNELDGLLDKISQN